MFTPEDSASIPAIRRYGVFGWSMKEFVRVGLAEYALEVLGPMVRGLSKNRNVFPLLKSGESTLKMVSELAERPPAVVDKDWSTIRGALNVTLTGPVVPTISNDPESWACPTDDADASGAMFTPLEALSLLAGTDAAAAALASSVEAVTEVALSRTVSVLESNPPRLSCACANTKAVQGEMNCTVPLAV
jgi:hypothetical protein